MSNSPGIVSKVLSLLLLLKDLQGDHRAFEGVEAEPANPVRGTRMIISGGLSERAAGFF